MRFTFPMDAEKDPKYLSINDYFYELPDASIARFPLAERDSSRILVFRNNTLSESVFASLPQLLPDRSTLVFNDSKVIHARIVFLTHAGHRIECFCLEPAENQNPMDSFGSSGPVSWQCMVGNARKWKSGNLTKSVAGPNGDFELKASMVAELGRDRLLEFSWDDSTLTFSEVLERAGELPIPPYLERETAEVDLIRYNTVYAGPEGSVAAPTAGLHFTDTVLENLKKAGIESVYTTLHVGAGTFRPVSAPTMAEHDMHAERVCLHLSELERLNNAIDRGPVVAVGTTSARSLESLYWLGLEWMKSDVDTVSLVSQWMPYGETIEPLPASREVVRFVIEKLKENKTDTLTFHTRLLIAPGYDWRVVDALITNFHQPNSTLLLLVAALIGESWRDVYAFALNNNFRFLSYGDSSLLYRKK